MRGCPRKLQGTCRATQCLGRFRYGNLLISAKNFETHIRICEFETAISELRKSKYLVSAELRIRQRPQKRDDCIDLLVVQRRGFASAAVVWGFLHVDVGSIFVWYVVELA